MKERRKKEEQGPREVAELRQRLEELEAVDAELHKTKTFYEQLVEGSGDAIVAVDRKGTVVTWNAGAERILGWKAEEILGRTHARHQTDETKEAIGKYLRQILAGELLDNLEMPLRTKDGTWVDTLITGSPVKDASGEVVAAHVIMKDISERKRTEGMLREREERLRMLTDQVPGVLWTTDRELRFTSSTGAGLTDLGLHPDQVVGMTLFEYFQTDSLDFVPLQAHRHALEGESERYEFQWEGRIFDCHVEPLKGVAGDVLGTIGFALDVTDRKKAEEALRDAHAFYEQLIGEAGDAIVAISPEAEVLAWNKGAEKIFGYASDEVLGRNCFDFLPLEVDDEIKQYFSLATLGEVMTNVEMRLPTKDGRWFDGLITGSLIKDSSQEVTAIIGIIKDISELKRAAQELLRAEKLASLGRLTAGACHEILNPLNIIKMRLHVMENDPATPPEVVQQVHTLEEQASRIAKITKGLLLYSRQRKPESSPLNLNDIVSFALDLLEHELKLQNIDVKIQLAESIPTLSADKDQLHQVFLNLLTNAYDAMPGGGELFISTGVAAEDGKQFVELRVEDTGEGIDPGHLERLFEPFFTTKPEGKGTGLGLSICQGIIEAHGGTIRAESGKKSGAAFVVRLPVS